MLKKLSGFTLIEILVVATIMIVLTAIGVAAFGAANDSARDAKRKSDLETIRQGLVLYKTQNGVYPSNAANIRTQLISGNFLTPPFPKEPDGITDYLIPTASTTAFCICSPMDNTAKGNSNASCSFAATTHYCVRQP